MMRNPDVTVRSRGVMEKCTYCVQRINDAIDAERRRTERAPTARLHTACQQSCPANAIVFGNINDPKSRVTKPKAEARNYGLLADHTPCRRLTWRRSQSQPRDRGEAPRRFPAMDQQKHPERPQGSSDRAAGYTFGTMTDKISAIVLIRPTERHGSSASASASRSP